MKQFFARKPSSKLSDRELIETGAGYMAYFYEVEISKAFKMVKWGLENKIISRKELREMWEYCQLIKLEKLLKNEVK